MALDFNNDPYGAWGTLIGTILGQSYNNNAQKRERAKADRITDELRNANAIQRIAEARNANIGNDNAGQVIANQMAQQAGVQGAQQATGLGSLNQPSIDYMGQGAQYAEQQDPYQLSVPSPLEQLKGAGGKEYAVNRALQANQTAINNEKAAQSALAASPQVQAAYNWNPDYTEDILRKKLREAGVRQEIIDEKVGEAKKDIAKRARDVLMPSIITNLYGTTTTDAKGNSVYVPPNQLSYAKAMVDLQTLAQYDPETAKTFMSGVVAPKDLYNANEYDRRYKQQRDDKREDAKTNRQWNREDKNTDFKQKVLLAGIRADGKGNSKNSISTADYKEALKRMGEIESYYEEHHSADPNFKLPSSMQEEWEELNAMKAQYRRERRRDGSNNNDNNSTDDETPVDWNDWNSIMAGINQAQKDGHSAKEILALVENKLGKNHPWYQNIASSFNHDAKQKEAEDQAERQRRLNETLFPNANVNTTDHTIASIGNFASDIGNGRTIWNIAHR